MTEPRAQLEEAIDTIEGGYEFLLAYAAQGRHTDRDARAEQSPRPRLAAMAEALAVLPGLVRELAGSAGVDPAGECAAFFDAVERDASVSAAAVRLVLAAGDLSSQLVDNLNASIHLRALLTDLFVLDEALKR
jgi:hypothetical protein